MKEVQELNYRIKVVRLTRIDLCCDGEECRKRKFAEQVVSVELWLRGSGDVEEENKLVVDVRDTDDAHLARDRPANEITRLHQEVVAGHVKLKK